MDSLAMNGGDGANSYFKNSKLQKEGSDRSKALIHKLIREKLEVCPLDIFRIADLGCSVGPNTFTVVQNIIDAVEIKYKSKSADLGSLEFQVFFNDNVTNDFNKLFTSLPSDRPYLAAGVPGSFYDRLFPKASLNFVHSSYAIHWLTKSPEKVLDGRSPAWNEGRIFYVDAPKEVVEAYTSQFAKDMGSFLSARAKEMAVGGLMAITTMCRPSGTCPPDFTTAFLFHRLESCLTDMVKEGLVNKDEVDAFNMPLFMPSASEIRKLVEKNGCFSIEGMEKLYRPSRLKDPSQARIMSNHLRAATEGIISKHFGHHVVEDLFERYSKKLEEFSESVHATKYEMLEDLLVVVKRTRTD